VSVSLPEQESALPPSIRVKGRRAYLDPSIDGYAPQIEENEAGIFGGFSRLGVLVLLLHRVELSLAEPFPRPVQCEVEPRPLSKQSFGLCRRQRGIGQIEIKTEFHERELHDPRRRAQPPSNISWRSYGEDKKAVRSGQSPSTVLHQVEVVLELARASLAMYSVVGHASAIHSRENLPRRGLTIVSQAAG
jgi:hypothetical protein